MSTTTGPRSPGWHPDPDGGDYLRHWNGRRWGTEKRPRPSWAGGGKGPPHDGDNTDPGSASPVPGPPPAPARPPRRWLVLGAVVISLLVFAVVVVSVGRGPRIPPRSVSDAAFTRRADRACKQVLPPLQEQRPQRGERTRDRAEVVARKVDRTADGLERLVGRLRGLPVASADEARVERWLADFDSYIAVGRRYSAALRRGDSDAPTRAAREGDRLTRRIYLFSMANDMPSCVL